MIFFVCFDLMPKDKQTMLKSFQKETYRDILQNLEYLDLSMAAATNFRRKHPEMTNDELNAFMLKNTKAKYKTLKCEPKILKLIRSMHTSTLNSTKYPYVGEERQKKGSKNKVERGAQQLKGGKINADAKDIYDNPRLFVFVAGGLSHHEVVSIANLQKEIPAQIIPGSNQIISVNDYLQQLESLHKKETMV